MMLTMVSLLPMTTLALAADSPERPQCFDVIALPRDADEAAIALKVNKCTGEAWYLGRLRGAAEGYQWFSISTFQ